MSFAFQFLYVIYMNKCTPICIRYIAPIFKQYLPDSETVIFCFLTFEIIDITIPIILRLIDESGHSTMGSILNVK